MRVAGELRFESVDEVLLEGARVVVSVLDVSRVDDAAVPLREQVITLPRGATSAQPVPFELDLPAVQAGRSLVLSAHVDLSRSGQRSPGDFITMESYPLAARVLRMRRIE
jgi:hypothetical protein